MYKVTKVENGWILSEYADAVGIATKSWVFTTAEKMGRFLSAEHEINDVHEQ